MGLDGAASARAQGSQAAATRTPAAEGHAGERRYRLSAGLRLARRLRACACALLGAIRSASAAPIRRLIVTHYHSDHFYGLPACKSAGAEIRAHKSARDDLRYPRAAMSKAGRERLASKFDAFASWIPLVLPASFLLPGACPLPTVRYCIAAK
ncbi:MAG: MBL fold metallo-hydrolase [Burkholderiales bacterium]|nr:MBL fold metallo-hydrolase [Burkholderiales bacterium]